MLIPTMDLQQSKNIMGAFLTLALVLSHPTCGSTTAVNNCPVIGILSQESYQRIKQFGNEFVLSEYVKYLEMAGASVVTVKGGQTKEYYIKLFKHINGVLFPGGGVKSLEMSSYGKSGMIMYELAIEANNKGDYFPIWGTCQGFELLTVITAKKNVLQQTDSENLPLPLTLLPAYNESRMLGKAPQDIIYYLTHENVTANYHHHCLKTETYEQSDILNTFYRAISVNQGRKGVEYISTMEAFDYPFYAVQWHPEKNIFNREILNHIDHSFHAVKVGQYFANFFVNEARKNNHKFPSDEERSHAVIENDNRVFTPYEYFDGYFYNVSRH